ncbi:MAG: hypothetical protein NTX05_08430 [Fusobacteria bacterium]|nr:hypothetical protein [Fusobacteriota bacterium]
MARKRTKIIYSIIVCVVIFFAYELYFQKINPLNISSIISRYRNVHYTIDGNYSISAKKQEMNEKQITMHSVKVEMNGSILYSDSGILDIKTNDLKMQGNVHGITASGWKISSSELDYEYGEKLLISPNPIVCIQEKKGLKLIGNSMSTSNDFTKLLLTGNCIFIDGKNSIHSDKMDYSKGIDSLTASGHVVVNAKNSMISGEKIKNIVLTSSQFTLNRSNGEITCNQKFNANLDGTQISGNSLEYNLNTQNGKIYQNVTVVLLENHFNGDEVDIDGKNKVVIMSGNVQGSDPNEKFTASTAKLDGVDNTITLSDVLIKRNDGITLVAQKSITHLLTKITQFFGSNTENVVVTQGENQLESPEINYDGKIGQFQVPGNYSYKGNNKGNIFFGSGTNLLYSKQTGNGSSENFTFNSKAESIKADELTFNRQMNTVELKKNIVVTRGDYTLTAADVKSNRETQVNEVIGEFALSNLTENRTLTSTHMFYSDSSQQLTLDNPFQFTQKGYVVNGDKLNYNVGSGNGVIAGDLSFTNTILRENGTTDQPVTISNGHMVSIPGNIRLIDGMATIITSDIDYDTLSNLGVIHGTGVMSDPTNSYKVFFENGEINGIQNFVVMNNVTGKLMPVGAQEIDFNTQSANYYYNTDFCSYDSPATYTSRNVKFVISKGSMDFEHNLISGISPEFTTSEGDQVVAASMNGNLNIMEFEFDSNVQGVLYNNSTQNVSGGSVIAQKMTFTGESAKLFMQGNSSGSFISRRVELRKKCQMIYQGGSTLNADFIEGDLIKNILFAKGHAKFKTAKSMVISGAQDLVKVSGSAEYIESDMDKNQVILNNHVKINTHTLAAGSATIHADKAIIYMNKNQAVLIGNATVTRKSDVIKAQKATFNIITNELVGNKDIDMDLEIPISS